MTEAPASFAESLTEFVERLNLASPASIIGAHFPEIVALTCLVAGGFLILYGWRHHRYVLAVMGMLAGGWLGLLAKAHLTPGGSVPALLYLAAFGGLGAFLACTLHRFVGIVMGGFMASCVAVVILPAFIAGGPLYTMALAVTFLIGGGLGVLYPRFFFIFNTTLVGASFATYGLSVFLARTDAAPSTHTSNILLHLGVFLPLLCAGVAYQYWTAGEADEAGVLPPTRMEKAKAKSKESAKPKEDREPVGAKA